MQTVSERSIVTILLVHGTFAREAAWTREGSLMYAALSRRFPEARLERFEWSGANSVLERGDASMALRTDLISRINNGQRVYVVAHSHGGNVALNAITHLEPLQIDQVALCCLATPFFHAKKRQIEILGRWPLIWGFSGIGIVLSAILNVALMHSDYRIAVTSVVVPLVMAVGVVLGWEVEEMQGSMSEFYICQLRSDAPKRLNLHIVRISGDEASLVLGLGQMLAWASNRMYEAVLRGLAFGLVVWPPRLWYLASTVVLVAAVVGLVEGVYPGAWLGVEAYTLITIVSLAAAICFLGAFTRIL